jgi:uncharacterized protein YbjT (DUF2867 family)
MPNHIPGEKARILVTGATGTVGKELVQQLVASGHKVRILIRDPSKMSQTNPLVEPAVGDLDKSDTLLKAMMGIEKMFLLTASTLQDKSVIEEAGKTGVHHLVKLSTQEAGWVPVKGHGYWHHEREELIKSSGLAWTFLRPCMFMSTTTSWAGTIKEKGIVKYPGGSGIIAPIDPWDVATVAASALTQQGHEAKGYELTGPESLTFWDMTQILSQVLGKPIQYVEESDADFSQDLLNAHLPQYVVDGLVETFAYIRKGEFAHLTDTVEQVTGHKPHSFEFWCKGHKDSFE